MIDSESGWRSDARSIVLAQIWDRDGGHMDGGWWWVLGIGWLVFLAAIVVIVVGAGSPV
jgi:hypothetical protein